MQQQLQMQAPPRPPGSQEGSSRAPLDSDYDEELHADVSAPPPPPPPRTGNGSVRKDRKLPVEDDFESLPPQPRPHSPRFFSSQQQHREPFNRLSPEAEHQHPFGFSNDPPKEYSGCDHRGVNHRGVTKLEVPTKTKKKKTRPSPRPPKQPGSKSAEYGSRIESFHQIMLENIEKETMLIQRQGSFRIHQKKLGSKTSRRHSTGSNGGNGENSENAPQRRSRDDSEAGDDTSNVSLLKETMNDISVAAASTMETLRSAIEKTRNRASGKGDVVVGGINLNAVAAPIACVAMPSTPFGDEDEFGEDNDILSPTNTARKERSTVPAASPSPSNLLLKMDNDVMKRTMDAFRKVVVDATSGGAKKDASESENRNDRSGGGQSNETNEENRNDNAWGVGNILANAVGWEGGEDDDDDGRSRATYDTWDEENSVLRRLGSWGTVNSQFTAGTAGTGATFGTMATYDTEGPSVIGPVSAAVAAAAAKKAAATDGSPQNGDELVVPGSHHLRNTSPLHDDDGSLIDPKLVEAAIKKQQQKEKDPKKQKKRRVRRKRVVKFDYPPISSLRQYTKPDPEDLPKLFFTEEELDQIEDDRYSTMSTDDIEIVAVSSKETSNTNADGGDDALDAKAAKKKSSKKSAEEPGMKSVKGRSGTPNRRRTCDGESEKSAKDEETDGPKSPRRLVKGVQIYLRERSTGTT